MKFILGAILVSGLLVGGFAIWAQGEIDAFKVRCLDAGGERIHQTGRAMSGWLCIDAEGRIVDVEGPGL